MIQGPVVLALLNYPVSDAQVRIGEHKYDEEGEGNLEMLTMHVKKVTINNCYYSNYYNNYDYGSHDIAIIELAEEVDLTVYTPACMAECSGRIFHVLSHLIDKFLQAPSQANM